MRPALEATTGHRGVELRPLSDVIGDLPQVRQQAYSAFVRRLGPDAEHLPSDFGEVVATVVEFVDPLALGDARDSWHPETRKWV